MSIPVDRLYHFIADVVDDDIIIYRWSPHGSKKLDDLSLIKSYTYINSSDIERIAKTPVMICHDQEPLMYDLYSEEELLQSFQRWLPSGYKNWVPNKSLVMSYIKNANIRAAISIPSGFDRDLLLHSEQRSKQLALYERHGLVGVYYWSHALLARDWFRYAQHDFKLLNDQHTYCFDFLILNRAWSGTREYRLKLTEFIIDRDLVSSCLMRFNAKDQDQDYRDHVFVNSALRTTRQDLHQHFAVNLTLASASADYSTDDYHRCGIDVVLETLFDDDRLHLTEKSLRPIACSKPFILAGTAGSLDYLRGYGFQTFHPYINESYDQECDPVKRLDMIVNEMLRIKNMNQLDKQRLWTECEIIARKNQKYFFSDAFHNRVVDEFRSNYHQAMQTCRFYHNKNDLRQWLNLREELLGKEMFGNWRRRALQLLDDMR